VSPFVSDLERGVLGPVAGSVELAYELLGASDGASSSRLQGRALVALVVWEVLTARPDV
jgi:hypothetical protein